MRTAIRALKTWRDTLGIKKGKYRPSSFLLELVCVWAYEEAQHQRVPPHPYHAHHVFVDALRLLALPEIRLAWWNFPTTKRYSESGVPEEILKQRPLVLDPIKPWNNVVREENLRLARRHAELALQ